MWMVLTFLWHFVILGAMKGKYRHKVNNDGSESWHKNEKRHRVGGPAITLGTGYEAWYIDGKLHRTDGPAMTWSSGSTAWYIENERIWSYKDFQHFSGCSDGVLMILKLRWGNTFN